MSAPVKEPLFHVVKRDDVSIARSVMVRLVAIVLALIVCAVIIVLLTGMNPLSVYAALWDGAVGTSRRMWITLRDAAILLCIGFAVMPAFRMRFWNTGAEGQTLVAVLGAIAVAFYAQSFLPNWLLLVLMFAAALISGIVWAIIPAAFKAIWNTNETLFTLMMNYVATFLVEFFLVIWVENGSSTLGSLKFEALPSFLHDYFVIVMVALILSVVLYVYLKHSKHGYEISVVGESVRTAQYSGINVRKVIVRTMIVSGALCGVAGYLIAAGLDKTVTATSVGGQGFTAIMVAWLAKFNPLVMLLTSGLISLLSSGAAEISKDFGVRGALPDVIIGIILFFIIGSEFFINYRLIFHTKRRDTEKGGSIK